MRYSDQVIENVRDANSILDVISSHVKLNRKGKYYFGLCPFHNEKTPSFSVDPDRQYYYCYSCGNGGDVFRFVMETEKLSFTEALQRLAEHANITLPESSDPVYNRKLSQAKQRKDRYINMYAEASSFFTQMLASDIGAPARAYLQKRLIRADTARRFGLGYAPPGWDGLYKRLASMGFSDVELSDCGLIQKGRGGSHYDRFRDRLIFPIQDVSGKTVAFGGRAFDESTPKYLNSPETPFFSKGKTLYGLNLSKNTKEKYFIIVEGYMDLISLSSNGVDNVVAPLGTALTDAQAGLLRRYSDGAVIAFDADSAGQAAALRGIDLLVKRGFQVRVLTIPQGKDPDEFINTYGPEAFRGLVSKAEALIDYKIAALRREHAEGKVDDDVRFLKSVVLLLAGVSDEVEREIYISRIAAKYGITEGSLKAEIGKALQGGAARYSPDSAPRYSSDGAASNAHDGAARYSSGVAPHNSPDGAPRYASDSTPRNGLDGAPRYSSGVAPRNSPDGAPHGGPDSTTRYSPDGTPPGAAGLMPIGWEAPMPDDGQSPYPDGGQPPYPDGGQPPFPDDVMGFSPAHAGQPAPADNEELFVLALLSIDNSLKDIIKKKYPPALVKNENVRKAISYVCGHSNTGEKVNGDNIVSGALVRFLTPDEADRFLGILHKECHCDDNRRAMEIKINSILSNRRREGMINLSAALDAEGLPEAERVRLREQLVKLQKNKGA